MTYQFALPIVIHSLYLFEKHQTITDTYILKLFMHFGVANPMRLFRSIILYHLMGVEFHSHYRQFYPEIKSYFGSYCSLYGVDRMMGSIRKITTGMASWKLTLIQAGLIKIYCQRLIRDKKGRVILDIDVTALKSASSEKEGAEAGYNKKNKGKPCFQLSAAYLGRIFVDAKLFPGCSNPKDFFRKTVKRVLSLNLKVDIVRADRAYMTLENLLMLTKLSLGYAIGAPATFTAVKEGIKLFKKLSRQKSSEIISVAKGVALLDLGEVTLKNGVKTRIVIVRRINRKKKNNQWRVKRFHYAIAANLELSAVKLYKFYHKRQCIESGFRELKNHYHLERLPFQTLKADEFWIKSKMTAMMMVKIFQLDMLPKSMHKSLLKTLMRRVFQKGLHINSSGQVKIVAKGKYTWLLRRLLRKLERMNSFNICVISNS